MPRIYKYCEGMKQEKNSYIIQIRVFCYHLLMVKIRKLFK